MQSRTYRILLCLILLCTLIPYSALAALRVTFFDSGDGAALLQSDGQTMLIDAGAKDDSDKLLTYLSDFDIPNIDLLASTSIKEDSANGLDAILNKYQLGTLWLPGTGAQTPDPIFAKAQSLGAKAITPEPGDQMDVGYAKVTVIGPSGYGTVPYLMLRVEYEGQSLLFLPGADALGEGTLTDSGADLHADVLSVGGEGIPSQSILDQVSPLWVVDVGEAKEDALSGIQESGMLVLSPAKNGIVTFTLNGKELAAEYEASGITIQNSVNVRKEATTKAGKALTLSKGSVVSILGTAAGDEGLWYHIEADGKVGYVRGDLIREISKDEAEKQLAEATPKPRRSNNGTNGGSSGEDVPEEEVSCH